MPVPDGSLDVLTVGPEGPPGDPESPLRLTCVEPWRWPAACSGSGCDSTSRLTANWIGMIDCGEWRYALPGNALRTNRLGEEGVPTQLDGHKERFA